MKIVLLTILAAILPAHSFAATTPAKLTPLAYSQKISGYTKWDDVIAEMKTIFPGPTVKEFEAVVKDQAFPSIRLQKNTLIITNNRDGKKTYVTLEANGTALFNGKPLVLDPLAAVADEVNRMAEVGGGRAPARSAWLKLLMDEAFADSYGGVGATAVAYSASSSWEGKSCSEAEPGSEASIRCTMMGVDQIIDLHQQNVSEDKKFKPISLKCPTSKTGVVDYLVENSVGTRTRMRVAFKGEDPIFYNLEFIGSNSSKAEPLFKGKASEMSSDYQPKMHAYLDDLSKTLRSKICFGGNAIKQRFMARLDWNKAGFRKTENSGGASDSNTSME